MKKIILILSIIGISNYGISQIENTILEFKEIKPLLEEIYGNHYEQYCEDNKSLYLNALFFLQKIEIIDRSEAPYINDNLKNLEIRDKYNPNMIKHDNIAENEEYKIKDINFLKYRIEREHKYDLYYKIYKTNKVLKINKEID